MKHLKKQHLVYIHFIKRKLSEKKEKKSSHFSYNIFYHFKLLCIIIIIFHSTIVSIIKMISIRFKNNKSINLFHVKIKNKLNIISLNNYFEFPQLIVV